MVGKVIEVRKLDDRFTELSIEEYNTKMVMKVTVENTETDFLDKTVSTFTTVTNVANANLDYVFPEGTIGS